MFLLRAVVFVIVLGVVLWRIPPVRRWLGVQLRSRDRVALKQVLYGALIIYFLLSLVLTLRDCSQFA